MTKTIVLTDLTIKQITINYEQQNVRVVTSLVDADGVEWENKIGFFWVTMPSEPTSNDFLLPPEYIPLLVGLRDDADAALTAIWLI